MAWKGGDKSAGGKRSGIAAGFVGLGDYLARSKERGGPDHRIVAFGSNTDAADIHQAMREMESIAAENPRLKKPLFHWGFALPKDKETGRPLEHLAPEQWEAIVDRSVRSLGLEGHQVVWVVHEDAGHEHVHIVANRAPLDGGPAWRPSHDHYRMRETARWAEIEFELSRHPEPERTASHRRTDREFRAVLRSGEATFWSDAITAFREALSWQDLAERLAARGFVVEAARDHRGGVILRHAEGPAKALGAVHPGLTGPKLARRFGETFEEFQARGLPEPPPTVGERRPLDVDRLVNELQAHHATWTVDDARRAARPFPSGPDVLRDLWASERVLQVEPGLFTTREIVRLEQETFELAQRVVRSTGGHAVPLATSEPLTGEHRDVVRAALGDEGLFLVQGPPGSGKTTAAKALVDSYRAAGYRVYGAAVTGKAAEGLRHAADVDARTLASWRMSWEHRQGSDADGSSVLVVDEASMLSLQDMKPLLEHAADTRMKLVLIGDVDQLPPVGAGDPFRRMLEEYGAARLTEIRRQQIEWMREASRALVRGDAREALAAYEARDRVRWVQTRDDARSALVMQYFEDRAKAPDQTSLLTAYRNADVRALNDQIRALRRERGELEEGRRIGSRDYAPGDRVLFRRNEGQRIRGEGGEAVPVQNGTLGTVLETAPDRLSVRLDSGVSVRFDPADYTDLDHGYAVSLYKSQGVTVDRAYVLADRHLDAHGFLVAATRHRSHLEIYVLKSEFRDAAAFEESITRRARPDLVRDYVDPEQLAPAAAPEASVDPASGDKEARPERSPEVSAEDLDREIRRALVRAFRYRSAETLPTAAELARLDERVEAVREGLRALPGSPDRRLSVARLEEITDQLRHQVAAAEVIRTAWHGLEDDYARALDRYRSLPEPRLLPEPPTVDPPAHGVRALPEDLPDELREAVRTLEHRAHTLRTAALRLRTDPQPLDPPTAEERPLLELWRDGAERAEARLEKAVSHARAYVEETRRLEALPGDEAHAPEAAAHALRAAELETRIHRLAHLRPSPRHVLEELDRHVVEGIVHRRDHGTPLDEIRRAYGLMRRWDALTGRVTELLAERSDLGKIEHLKADLSRLELELRHSARRHTQEIYARPDRALRIYDSALREHGAEAVAEVLRTAPERIGRLRGFLVTGRARAAASAFADELVEAERKRAQLDEQVGRFLRLTAQIGEAVQERDPLGDRRRHLEAILRHGLALPRAQRRALPEPVRSLVDEARGERARIDARATELLKGLAQLGAAVAKGQAERLLPRPVQKVLRLARALQALRKNAPAYLVGQFLPAPVRLALFVVRGIRRERSIERDMGWSR